MKAETTLRAARTQYTPALVALAALHEPHGAFLGGNFFDCARCQFHAHNGSEGTAEEHDGDYTYRRTYAVEDGELRVTAEWFANAGKRFPSYVQLYDALEVIANGGPYRTAHEQARDVAKRALHHG